MSSTQVITLNGMYLTEAEIVNHLEQSLTLADKKLIAAMPQNKLVTLHHGLGTFIRNSYGLWTVNPITENWRTNPASHIKTPSGVDISPDHPDNMAMRIIQELWTRFDYLRKP